MAPEDERDLIEAVVTCEGNLHDPDFSDRFQSIVSKLKSILYTTNKKQPLKVRKIEPWNSVRVTISIPKEAAQRLRLLAQQGSNVLRQLGILSVQVEGDQVISLTLAGRFNEPQEVILRQSNEAANTSTSTTTSSASSLCSTSSSAASTSSVPTPIVPVAGPSGVMVSLDILSSSTSSAFRSPNVVAPSGESIPFPPKNAAVGPRPTLGGPFPFASMTHAAHTMQRSETSSSTQIPSVTNSTNSTPVPTSNNANATPSPTPPVIPASVTGGSLVRSSSAKVTVSPSTPPPTLTPQPLSAPGRKNNNNNNVNSPNVNVVSKPQPVLVTAVVNVKNNSNNNNSNNGSSQNNGNNSTNSSFIPPSNPPNVVVVVNSTNFSKPAQVQGDAKLNPSQHVQHLQHHHSKLQTVLKTSSTGVTHSLGKDKEPTPPPIGPPGNPQLTSSGKPRQFLINPLTGHLEPMPSESSSESEGDEEGATPGTAQPKVSHVLKSSKGKDNPTTGWDKLSLPPPKPVKITLDALKLNRLTSNPGSGGVISRKSREDLETAPSLAKENSIAYVNNTNPVDKIKKLRLKIEKSESLSPASYKMDVAYVKKSEKSSVSTVMSSSGASASLGGQFSVSPSSAGSTTLSSTQSSLPSQSDVPRVPPLHISLRGKNAAVVVSPRRDENKDLPNTSSSPTSISPSSHNDNKPILVSVNPPKSTSSASRAIKRAKIRLRSSDGSSHLDESVINKKTGKNIQARPVPATTSADEREDPLKARLKSEEKFNSSTLSSDFSKAITNKSPGVSDLITVHPGTIVSANATLPSATSTTGIPPKVKKHRRKSESLSSRQIIISSQPRDKSERVGEVGKPATAVEASQLMKLLSQQVSVKDEEELPTSAALTPASSSSASLVPSSLIPCDSDKEREPRTSLLPSGSTTVPAPSTTKFLPSELVTAALPLGKENESAPGVEQQHMLNSTLPHVKVSDIPKHNEGSSIEVEVTSTAIPDTKLSKRPHEKPIPDLVALPHPQSSLDSNKPEVNTSQSLLFSLSTSTPSHPLPQIPTTSTSLLSTLNSSQQLLELSNKDILGPAFATTVANSHVRSSDAIGSASSAVTQSAIVSRSVSELVVVNPVGKSTPPGSGLRSAATITPITSSPFAKSSVQSLGSSILNQMLTGKEPSDLIVPITSACKILPSTTVSSTASLLVNPVTVLPIHGNPTATVSSAMLLSKVQTPSSLTSAEVLLEEDKSDGSQLLLSKLDSVAESSAALLVSTSSPDILKQQELQSQSLSVDSEYPQTDGNTNISSKRETNVELLGPKVEGDVRMEVVKETDLTMQISEKKEFSSQEVRLDVDTKVPMVLGESEIETGRVVVSSPPTVMAAPNISSLPLDPLPLRLMALSLPSTPGVTSSSTGGKPEDQSGIPGEDSGIDSMDALSEKSPNQGESPARKNDNDHHFCDNSTSSSHSNLQLHPKNSPASDRSISADFDCGVQLPSVESVRIPTNTPKPLNEESSSEHENCGAVEIDNAVVMEVETIPSSEASIVTPSELKDSDHTLTIPLLSSTDTPVTTSTGDNRNELERESSPIRNKVPLPIPLSILVASSVPSTLTSPLTCPEQPQQEQSSFSVGTSLSAANIVGSDSAFDSVDQLDLNDGCIHESAESDNKDNKVIQLEPSASPIIVHGNLSIADSAASSVPASPAGTALMESLSSSSLPPDATIFSNAVEATDGSDDSSATQVTTPTAPQEELSVIHEPRSAILVETSSTSVVVLETTADINASPVASDLVIQSESTNLENPPSSNAKEVEVKPDTLLEPVTDSNSSTPKQVKTDDDNLSNDNCVGKVSNENADRKVPTPVPITLPDISVPTEPETAQFSDTVSCMKVQLPTTDSVEETRSATDVAALLDTSVVSTEMEIDSAISYPHEAQLTCSTTVSTVAISSIQEREAISGGKLAPDPSSTISTVQNPDNSLSSLNESSCIETMEIEIENVSEKETRNLDQTVKAENPPSRSELIEQTEVKTTPVIKSSIEEDAVAETQQSELVSTVELSSTLSVSAPVSSDIKEAECTSGVTLESSSKPEEQMMIPLAAENNVPITSVVLPENNSKTCIEEPKEDSKNNGEGRCEKLESKEDQGSTKVVEDTLILNAPVEEEREFSAIEDLQDPEKTRSQKDDEPSVACIDQPTPSSIIPASLPSPKSSSQLKLSGEASLEQEKSHLSQLLSTKNPGTEDLSFQSVTDDTEEISEEVLAKCTPTLERGTDAFSVLSPERVFPEVQTQDTTEGGTSVVEKLSEKANSSHSSPTISKHEVSSGVADVVEELLKKERSVENSEDNLSNSKPEPAVVKVCTDTVVVKSNAEEPGSKLCPETSVLKPRQEAPVLKAYPEAIKFHPESVTLSCYPEKTFKSAPSETIAVNANIADPKVVEESEVQHVRVCTEKEAAIVSAHLGVSKQQQVTTLPLTTVCVTSSSPSVATVVPNTCAVMTTIANIAVVTAASGNVEGMTKGKIFTATAVAGTTTTTSASPVVAKSILKTKELEEVKVKVKVDASTSTRAGNSATAATIIYPSKSFACLNSSSGKEDNKEKVQAIVHPAPNHSSLMMMQPQPSGETKLVDGKVRASNASSVAAAARASRKDVQLPVLIPAPNPLRGESHVTTFHAQGKPQMPNITPMQKVKLSSDAASVEMVNSTKANSTVTTNATVTSSASITSAAPVAAPTLAPILIRPNFQSPISFTLDQQQHGKTNQIQSRQSIEISLPPKVEVKPNVNISVPRGVPNVIQLTKAAAANLSTKGIAVTGAPCLPVSKASPISVSLAHPLAGSTVNAAGTPTVFAIHPHQYHHQSAITVLPSGHKMVPIKLVTIPKQNQAQLPLQSVVGSNRSSPTILEHVNLVTATSRSSSPNSPVSKPKVHGNTVQSSPLNLSSVAGGNLHLVPISVSSTSATGTSSPMKVLVSSPMKMQPNLLQSMMVKGQIVMTNQNQSHHHPTTIRVVRPLLSQDLEPPKLEQIDTKSQVTPSQAPRGLVVETGVGRAQERRQLQTTEPPTPTLTAPATAATESSDKNSIYERADGVQVLDTEDTNEDELFPFEADIIHDEKDLADVLADENVQVSENGIDLDSLDGPYDLNKIESESNSRGDAHPFQNYPRLRDNSNSCRNSNYRSSSNDITPSTPTAESSASGASDDTELDKIDSPIPAIRASSPLYTYSNRSARNSHSTSESRSPSPPEPDVHGEDQEIIDCLSRSPSQPKLSPQNKPLSAVENDNDYGSPTKPDLHPGHTYGGGGTGRDSSTAPTLEQLSIEIPPVDLMVMSPAASEESRKHTRSTRSNTRLVSPDITAFRSDTPKPTKFTNKPDALVLRNSPKPSPTGSMKTHSPGLGSIQPSTSARASPVPNQLTVNSNSGIYPITGRNSPNIIASSLSSRGAAGATAFINKRKRQESDSSNASKDENSEENKIDIDLNSRPGKRRCSENAAELIKACIGVEDTPKRNSSLIKKMELQDNKAKEASSGKGKKPIMSVVLEEAEDDLESVDILNRGRSGGRSSRGSSEDRSSSRGSSVHRNTVTPKQNTKEEENKDVKANSRVNNRTMGSKEVTNKAKASGQDGPGPNSIRKDDAKQSSIGRRSNRNAPSKEKSPLALAKPRTNFRKEPVTHGGEKPTTPSTSPENGNPRRKTRSSVAVGASDSMPTFKRRRISKDAKS